MGQRQESIGFGAYLRDAIIASGFATPTQFARTVGTDPSVVLRWISEEQRPTIRSIERIAPVLGRTINEMVEAAYPMCLGETTGAQPPALHPLAYELGRMLAKDSPIAEADRQALLSVLDRIMDPYRRDMLRRATKHVSA